MPPNPKVKAAFLAMKSLGISEDKVKPVLKNLLKLYDKNWELIEEENYRALADAIFEYDENKVVYQKRKSHSEEEEEEEEAEMQELQRPLKRLRRRNQENESIASPGNSNHRIGGPALLQPKQEEEFQPPQLVLIEQNKGKQPVSSNMLSPNESGSQFSPKDKGFTLGRPSHEVCMKDANDSGTVHLPKQKLCGTNLLTAIKRFKPKDESFTEDILLDETPPIAIHPESLGNIDSITDKEKIGGKNGSVPISSHVHGENKDADLSALQIEKHNDEPVDVPVKSSSNLEIASLSLGECFVELGKHCNDSGDRIVEMGPTHDVLIKPVMEVACNVDDTENLPVPSVASVYCNESRQVEKAIVGESAQNVESMELVQSDGTDPHGLIFPDCQAATGVQHSPLKGDDITNGEERVNISWVNEINNCVPPSFRYIPQNLVFEGASVSFALAQMDNGNCCPSCYGDCISKTVPCACANGGEFAYTIRGLVKESFLDQCIAMTRDPKRRSHFQCPKCPLERSKGGAPQVCNGHLKRKFIKECWRKCGCNRSCGNRVIQQGMSCRLQVFMTSEAKGWGIRTLDDLPKGTFVCEYIGEILTNSEVQKRNMNTSEGGKMYQIFLDSGWDSAASEDDKALCLDTTHYANVARFINHRCNDANLIEIPVEVESPMRHYYHLAFFTTRKVQALEELTWDYGIYFEEGDQYVNAFQCLCGSKSCRNRKSPDLFISHLFSCLRDCLMAQQRALKLEE